MAAVDRFTKSTGKLSSAIAPCINGVVNSLHAEGLIGFALKDDLINGSGTDARKANKLVTELERQLRNEEDPDDFLDKVSSVLKKQGERSLTQIANSLTPSGIRNVAPAAVTLPVSSTASSGEAPKDIFRKTLPRLTGPLGKEPNFTNVSNLLLGEKLITQNVLNGITSQPNLTDNQRGSEVAHELLVKIKASDDPVQCLLKICIVLEDDLVDDDKLRKYGANMRIQLQFAYQSPVDHPRAGLRERPKDRYKEKNSQQTEQNGPPLRQKKLSTNTRCWICVLLLVIAVAAGGCVGGGFIIYQYRYNDSLPSVNNTQQEIDKAHQTSVDSSYSSSSTNVPAKVNKDELKLPHLEKVIKALRDSYFDTTKWRSVGLSLGLYDNTLSAIESNSNNNVEECLRKTLRAWIDRKDGVGVATWSSLVKALRDNNLNAVAKSIEDIYHANS